VRLRYQISDFSGRQLNRMNRRAQSFETGDTVYVALKAPPGRGIVPATDEDLPADLRPFIPVAIDKEVDAARRVGDVVLRATVERAGENSVRLVYGAEQYFIPQFAGGDIEERIDDVIVEVRVADDGETAIKRLFIDDAEVEFH
ncbi:MAG: GDYXXLXY domain-containing protein, partial [Leptospiraceae bacterium]|nr:GDYXXLXY domain-containing protein [Leptospiraceae bacterium]